MIRPILAVFAIVAIGVMMGAASVAAAPVTLTKNVNETVELPSANFFPICDTDSVIMLTTTIISNKEWSNGKKNFQQITMTEFTDDEGNTIGKGTATRSKVTEVNPLPVRIIVQDTFHFNCINGASDPGFEISDSFGSTTTFDEFGVAIRVANHGP